MANDEKKTWSQRLTTDVIQQLEELKENTGIETYSLLFETMIERYYNPVKVNSENEIKVNDLQGEILLKVQQTIELEDKYKELNIENDNLIKELEKFRNYQTTLQNNISEIQSKNETLQIENSQLKNKLVNSVYVGPFNMKVLEKIAERESEKMGKTWNKSQIVNCFIDFRFVKGKLNAGFDSLSDSVIKKIKEEVL